MAQRLHTKNTNQTLLDSFHAARACHQRGDLAGAEALFSQLLAIDPADDEVLFLFGTVRVARGDLAAGLECIELAQSLNPTEPLMPYTQGVFLQQAGRLREACMAYQRCLGLQPQHQAALENLAAAHYEQDEFEAGLACAQRALAQAPESRLAIRAVANCLTALGRRAEALAVLDQGVALFPANPELHIHHAWELMANGNFDAGLREHEWRNLGGLGAENNARQVPFPRWQGEALAGKTVLVYGEAGVGDELMFAPYVLALLEAGAQCIVECEARLVPLFSRALPGCCLLPRSDQDAIDWDTRLASVDYAVSSMSLPVYFSPPLLVEPFLRPDPESARIWRDRLVALGPGHKVGVSWRGGASPKARALRSIAPDLFGELLVPGTHFISLQYGADVEECAKVSTMLHHMAGVDALRDLNEFSALIASLDLVISVDNSTVHFAAALGVPTWLLLPRYAEWRWGRNEADAARWYQGLRYFPQVEAGEAGWRAVIVQARSALAEFSAPARRTLSALQVKKSSCLPSVVQGPRALLVGDTEYWYHWGCSCTSLGLHRGLQAYFTQIRTLPLSQVLMSAPKPSSMADLQGDVFYNAFQSGCAGMLEKIAAADAIFINGEGSIHSGGQAALTLLYLAYIAKVRLGKVVYIVNHSCYPGSGLMKDGQTPLVEFYACVYRAVDLAVLRERISFEHVRAFGGRAVLGFDCLPLFIESTGICRADQVQRKIVFGGSVAWSPALVKQFSVLAANLAVQGYTIEILSGAKAYLADDEIGFVAAFSRELAALGVPHHLHFALSEREWLQALADAALVVSGRFHYSIAAAFLKVPFIVAESNTAKIAGLLDALCLASDSVSVNATELPQLLEKTEFLLANPVLAIVCDACLTELLNRARCNFDFTPVVPVMLRV